MHARKRASCRLTHWGSALSKLIFTRMDTGKDCRMMGALQEGGRIVRLFPLENEKASLLGRIYVGRVERIVPNQQAAFVRFAPGQRGYLHLSEGAAVCFADGVSREEPGQKQQLRPEDSILVQVSQEAMKGKLPRLTTGLNLSGRYFVITEKAGEIGISHKLPRKEQIRLSGLVKEILDEALPGKCPFFGVIARTNASGAKEEELRAELAGLIRTCEWILEQGRHRTDESLLYEPEPAWLRLIRDIPAGTLEKVVTDDRELYGRILDFIRRQIPQAEDKLTLYEDRLLPLSALFSLGAALEEALSARVWLKDGAFLIIEQTAAFVSIDVNSGKDVKGTKAQETYLRINLLAAAEIARQLRLRELSGMILVDFITMRREEDRQELLNALREAVRYDHAPTAVVDMTALGIVEMIRPKQGRPLSEALGQPSADDPVSR